MSLQEIQTSLQSVGETVQTAQDQLIKALESLENARETLQGVADHSAQSEHGQAVGLFQGAEQAISNLRARLEQFHPAVTSYLGSLGMGAAGDDSEMSPTASSSSPAGSVGGSNETENPKASANSNTESRGVEGAADTSTEMPPPEPPSNEPPAAESEEPEEEPVPVDKYREMLEDMYGEPFHHIEYRQNYLGEDSTSNILDAGDGNVVKIAKADEGFAGWYDDGDPLAAEHDARVEKLTALQRGKGIEGVEQYVTHGSLVPEIEPLEYGSDLIIVTQKVSGEPLGSMDDVERAGIPVEHYEKVIDTFTAMRDKGIIINPDPDSIVYDPDAGFIATDYNIIESHLTPYELEAGTVEDVAIEFGSPDAGTLIELDIAPTSVPLHAVKYHDALQRKLGDEAAARYRQKFGNLWPES